MGYWKTEKEAVELTDKYNGWANYETWAVNLWLSNNQPDYEEFRSLAEGYTKEQAYELGQAIRARVEEETDTIIESTGGSSGTYSGIISDIFHANLSLVDWNEIAEAFLET